MKCVLGPDYIYIIILLFLVFSLIQQAQKFFLEANESSDARNVCLSLSFTALSVHVIFHLLCLKCFSSKVLMN